jgi:hypothetical protein
MLPDTGIDDVKKQRNAEYAKHINDPVLSSLKMEGIRLLFFPRFTQFFFVVFCVVIIIYHDMLYTDLYPLFGRQSKIHPIIYHEGTKGE